MNSSVVSDFCISVILWFVEKLITVTDHIEEYLQKKTDQPEVEPKSEVESPKPKQRNKRSKKSETAKEGAGLEFVDVFLSGDETGITPKQQRRAKKSHNDSSFVIINSSDLEEDESKSGDQSKEITGLKSGSTKKKKPVRKEKESEAVSSRDVNEEEHKIKSKRTSKKGGKSGTKSEVVVSKVEVESEKVASLEVGIEAAVKSPKTNGKKSKAEIKKIEKKSGNGETQTDTVKYRKPEKFGKVNLDVEIEVIVKKPKTDENKSKSEVKKVEKTPKNTEINIDSSRENKSLQSYKANVKKAAVTETEQPKQKVETAKTGAIKKEKLKSNESKPNEIPVKHTISVEIENNKKKTYQKSDSKKKPIEKKIREKFALEDTSLQVDKVVYATVPVQKSVEPEVILETNKSEILVQDLQPTVVVHFENLEESKQETDKNSFQTLEENIKDLEQTLLQIDEVLNKSELFEGENKTNNLIEHVELLQSRIQDFVDENELKPSVDTDDLKTENQSDPLTSEDQIEKQIQDLTLLSENLEPPVDFYTENGSKQEEEIHSLITETYSKQSVTFTEASITGNVITKSEPTEQPTEEPIETTQEEPSTPVEDTNDFSTNFETFETDTDPDMDSIMNTPQLRVLTINDNEHLDSVIYRIQKNWILQFRLGPSLFGRKVRIFCNYPKNKRQFERDTYIELEWQQDEGCKNSDDTASYTEIIASVAGSFHYYFTYEDVKTMKTPCGSGFFLVDPSLKYGANEELPLDCIQCQTVLAKSLGKFSTWKDKLRVAHETGYNVIHFTPIQELGGSNSSYSLRNQHLLNPIFHDADKQVTFQDVESLVAYMRKEWKMLSICDIVLNHTANESDWLLEHPEATYNCGNCPYMRPSYLLDAALHQFSLDVSRGLYEVQGIPVEVNTEDHLNAIRYNLHTFVLPTVNIVQLFVCDVNKIVGEFLGHARVVEPGNNNEATEELVLIPDPEYKRLAAKIDLNLALKIYNVYRNDCFDEETRLKKCSEALKIKLEALNQTLIDEITGHLNAAVENVIAGIRYFRVQHDGPRIRKVTAKDPLVPRYFTDDGNPEDLKAHEESMYGPNSARLMAHNGWVMNDDPLKNFAASDSWVYLRRELIAWGDSVKLKYGEKPEDNPFVWAYMKEYVEKTAVIFDGVRLDNCHSTPIAVAEYMLDAARKVCPDLYVVAELFTNSDHKDNIFVNRLGITSLIREAMSAWDPHEQGRLVYRYGGVPVGSFYQPRMRPLVPTVAHALFLDLTHDNPCPIQKRSVYDLLPSSALVNMACCASGSNRGYDELVPHHIHVVDETRQYAEWSDEEVVDNPRFVNIESGIIKAKRALNMLHFRLGLEGYDQVFVDQMDFDVVAVTRHNPKTHESYVLVAFTAFEHPGSIAEHHQRYIRPLRVEGVLDEIVLEATLNHKSCKHNGYKYKMYEDFKQNHDWINGLDEYEIEMREHIDVRESYFFELGFSGNTNITELDFKNFKPGSVVVAKFSLPPKMQTSITKLRGLLQNFSKSGQNDLKEIIEKMSFADLNRVLYRCDQEERDDGHGFDVYDIPNYGKLVYAGLQGFISLLSTIRPNNDLGHPLCSNLRDGDWMIDYIWKRLEINKGTKELSSWIDEKTSLLKVLPRYLIPSYFDILITGLYLVVTEYAHRAQANFVKHGSVFVRHLALGSIQLSAVIKSADLPALSPELRPPKPPIVDGVQACVSLSAGLPHFSVGYMRNWGRDTFISLRGCYILTGRYLDARYHILAYAACLRHGLIPNLLDGGRNPRYNCRDSVWWWLYCIKSYVEEVPYGAEILNDTVSRIFPTDDSSNQPPGACDQKLHEVMQEALKVHFQGLAFRERNAGRQIDDRMTDKGFNNQIGIHPDTGFVFGGNEMNCGTWMDKMGSSVKAGNYGKPATPRDGSAVELIGLSKAVVSWLNEANAKEIYPYDGVERICRTGIKIKWTFRQWAHKIQDNFEKYFWVNQTPVSQEITPELINKRGIYKDCYGASQQWSDFQLRCNFPISMVVAPELFTPKHAWLALEQVEKHLLGPLGIKTLDPDDWAYRGDYDNSNDSADPTVAQGFNYHQGPEWVWPMGFYLRAKLIFAEENGKLEETVAKTKVILSRHFVELQSSMWKGLPELTNSSGAYCNDSSRTQAWSMACILEVLHDLQKLETKTSKQHN